MRSITRRFRGTVHPIDGLTAQERRALLELGFVAAMAGGDGEDDPPTDPPARTVPLDQLTRERKRAQDAETQAQELKARIEELEARDQSEVEKAVKRAEKAERERDEATTSLEAANTQREQDRRAGLVADAARAASFHDPRVAARMLDDERLADVTDERTAKAAVKALSESHGWLVAPTPPKAAGVEKVLSDGTPVGVTTTPDEVQPGMDRLRHAYSGDQ
jgi:hypothetical protein